MSNNNRVQTHGAGMGKQAAQDSQGINIKQGKMDFMMHGQMQNQSAAFSGSATMPRGGAGMPINGETNMGQAFTQMAPNLQQALQGSPLSFMDESVNASQNEPTISLNYSQAIVWQIKYIISIFLSKKAAVSASAELQYLSEKFGSDFDKYLIKELIEQIDLKDPNRAARDKNEAIKSSLLSQELTRMCMKPDFLKYFDEIAQGVFGDRYSDFLCELSKRLKLSQKMQLIIALSLAESCKVEHKNQCYTILKQKIVDYIQSNKQEQMEDYVLHRLNYMFSIYPEFDDFESCHPNPPSFVQAKSSIKRMYTQKPQNSNVSLRVSLGDGDLVFQNPSAEDPSNSLIRTGSDFEHLCQVSKFLQPWEVLLDLGHNCSFDYQVLSMALQDFKDINERTMANTILQLALNHTGQDQYQSKVAMNLFKTNKTGDATILKKEPIVNNTTFQWHTDSGHFSRAFRENFSNLNWLKVFEMFGELDHEVETGFNSKARQSAILDKKAYLTLMQIYNKSKPANLQVPMSLLFERQWKSKALQLSVLKNAALCYISGEDKTFNFSKCAKKLPAITDIELGQDCPQLFIDVWTSPEFIETLVMLSESRQYPQVRKLFDEPIQKLPEYLLLAIAKCEFEKGNTLLDEVLSSLFPIVIVNSQNSTPILKKLWDMNQELMIRGICECCRHDQRAMNLSRVLDITQEVKDSLIKIVYCQDYDFAVNLGILAGKRDFLHYDVWLKERIKKVGTPFVKAFLRYINEWIISPAKEFLIKNGYSSKTNFTPEDLEKIEKGRDAILERSHLSKERLCMTMELLENPANFTALVANAQNNEAHAHLGVEAGNVLVQISIEIQNQIKDVVAQYTILFPKQVSPAQSTEEIDKATNEYFDQIFNAEPSKVDEKIQELIVTLRNFQKSQVVKEQEIYACVLHGLFDEYRFLHKYPPNYLQRIAKLFGAIIKHKLLNDVLQGIALKFVIEAFRREGKRLMFGVIVVKEFFECLPDFPKQFAEIYQNREKIRQREPELYNQLGQLYMDTMMNNNAINQGESNQISPNINTGQPQTNPMQPVFKPLASLEQRDLPGGEPGPNYSTNNPQMFPSFEPTQGINRNQSANPQFVEKQGGGPGKDKVGIKHDAQKNFDLNAQDTFRIPSFVPSNQANQAQAQSLQPAKVPKNANLKPNQVTSQQRKISPQTTSQGLHNIDFPDLKQTYQGQDNLQKGVPQDTSFRQPQSELLNDQTHSNPFTSSMTVTSAAFRSGIPMAEHTKLGMPISQNVAQTNLQGQPQDNSKIRRNNMVQQPGMTSLPNQKLPPSQQQLMMPQQRQGQHQQMNIRVPPLPPTLQINAEARSFMPTNSFNIPIFKANALTPLQLTWQKAVDQKIEDAKQNRSKPLRFEDLIEDNTLAQPTQKVIDQIKLKCNNTGRNNFKQNLEFIKDLVLYNKSGKVDLTKLNEEELQEQETLKAEKTTNLNWFINYILTKRISGQQHTLHHIYIDLIRQLGHKDSISKTIEIAKQIFQRCLLIDETEFNKVSNKVGGTTQQSSQVTQYMRTLGSFLGSLTLANNRPIKQGEICLKTLLIQGFYSQKNRKNVITFVCAILKEAAKKSLIFKLQNPWMKSIIMIMIEIRDCLQQPQLKNLKDKEAMEMELALLDNIFNFSLNGVEPSTLLQACQNLSNAGTQQQIEIGHLKKQDCLVPERQPSSPKKKDGEGKDGQGKSGDGQHGLWESLNMASNEDNERVNNLKFIYLNVVMSNDKKMFLKSKFEVDDRIITELLTSAVEKSIEEILKPVVDRSVTIALITTKQLVLKDFAYDGDCDKLREALEQQVQNLAGSLALVTCREPLRLHLNNFLLKALKMACFNAGSKDGLSKMKPFEGMTMQDKQDMEQKERLFQYYLQDNEEKFHEIVQEASKDNLELGCKMIKKAVIDKAKVWVKQDKEIIEALEKRKKSKEAGEKYFVDHELTSLIADLPPQLRPSKTGLSKDQFQVYADFAKLNQRSKFDTQIMPGQGENGELGILQPGVEDQAQKKQQKPAIYDLNIESIINRIETKGELDSVSTSLLTLLVEKHKKTSSSKQVSQSDQGLLQETKRRLWQYCDNKFNHICQYIDNDQSQLAEKAILILEMILNTYTIEDLRARIMQEIFMEMEEMYILNADLMVLLLEHRIFSIKQWDSCIENYVRNCPGSLQERAYIYLAEIIKRIIFISRAANVQSIPKVKALLDEVMLSESQDSQTEMIKFCIGDVHEQLQAQVPSKEQSKLINYYRKWVELSQKEDSEDQEKEMNRYFDEMNKMGIATDQEVLFSFCKVMVQESIELCQHSIDGTKRPNNYTLDYRFIDSFIKLMLCLLTSFDLNKLQFMQRIFELIRQKLDEDHFQQKENFNQLPYYRMLMNILRAVTINEYFNPKTQRQILLDLANLFQDLNPNNYPAFAFAWLELISHKLFLPYFIKSQVNTYHQKDGEVDQVGANSEQQRGKRDQDKKQKEENIFQLHKLHKIKDLLVSCFTFIKHNLLPGIQATTSMRSFYTATMNIVLVILKDYPQFISDFHFNLVNALPDHTIQLKNMILAAFPKNIQPPAPFSLGLKVDPMQDVKNPRILSNFEAYLKVNNLKDDLDQYFATSDQFLINQICLKMMSSKERIHGKVVPASSVINAVVLFIAQKVHEGPRMNLEAQEKEKESIELFKAITINLNDETRISFINSIVNELRFPNSHTYFFCLILLRLFADSKPAIQEQISIVLFERLQALRPYPWGLMINFRELIQNQKYGFMKTPFIVQNPNAIKNLFFNKDRLRPFFQFLPNSHRQPQAIPPNMFRSGHAPTAHQFQLQNSQSNLGMQFTYGSPLVNSQMPVGNFQNPIQPSMNQELSPHQMQQKQFMVQNQDPGNN